MELTKVSMSVEANDALKRVVSAFPEWSQAHLGSKLVIEACRAILSDGEPAFPTIDYIRQQIQLERIHKAARDVAQGTRAQPTNYALNEEPDKQQAARKKHAA